MYDHNDRQSHPAPEFDVRPETGPQTPVAPFPPYPHDNPSTTPSRSRGRSAWWFAAAGVVALGLVAAAAAVLTHTGDDDGGGPAWLRGAQTGSASADDSPSQESASAAPKSWDRSYDAVPQLCDATDLSFLEQSYGAQRDGAVQESKPQRLPELGDATGMWCLTSFKGGVHVIISAISVTGNGSMSAEEATKTSAETDATRWAEGCGEPVDAPGAWDGGVVSTGDSDCYLAGANDDTVATLLAYDATLEVIVQVSADSATVDGVTTEALAANAADVAVATFDACAQ